MKIDDILNNIPPKGNKPNSLNKKYGIFGLTLGEELNTRLDKYCDKVGLTRATGKRFLKDMAETQGRVEVYNHVDYIINEGR